MSLRLASSSSPSPSAHCIFIPDLTNANFVNFMHYFIEFTTLITVAKRT